MVDRARRAARSASLEAVAFAIAACDKVLAVTDLQQKIINRMIEAEGLDM